MIDLYNGDCLIESDKIESGSVDLILTDLPYGTVKGLGGDIKKYERLSNSEWDNVIDTDKIKPKGSGKKTPKGTSVFVNMLISIYKSNAKKRKISYELSYDEFVSIINEPCAYCGDANENILKKAKYEDFPYTGIDRVDNSLGYVKENTVPCCEFCNRAKLIKNKIIKIAKGIEMDKGYFDIAKNRINEFRGSLF